MGSPINLVFLINIKGKPGKVKRKKKVNKGEKE